MKLVTNVKIIQSGETVYKYDLEEQCLVITVQIKPLTIYVWAGIAFREYWYWTSG